MRGTRSPWLLHACSAVRGLGPRDDDPSQKQQEQQEAIQSVGVWSISNFSCSLTSNITSNSMENLACDSLLRRWKIINHSHYLTNTYLFKRLGEWTFWAWEWKGWKLSKVNCDESVRCFMGTGSCGRKWITGYGTLRLCIEHLAQLGSAIYVKLVFPVQSRHHGNTLFLPCGHLDFELAVIAQNDEFKGDSIALLHGRQTSRLSPETQYLASILTDKLVKCICRNIDCAQGRQSLHSR